MDDIVLQRIFTKLDNIDIKVSDLCDRVGRIEQYHDDQDSHKTRKKWGWERFFSITASIGMVVAIYISMV